MTLLTSVRALPGVGPAKARLLSDLKIKTVKDLLFGVPRKYIDCTVPLNINQLNIGDTAAILANVTKVSKRQTRSRKVIIEATLTDTTGSISAIWFNQPYLENTLKRTKQAVFWGPVNRHWQNGLPVLTAPKIESSPKLIPIYSVAKGLSSRQLNGLVAAVLRQIIIKDKLPVKVRQAADVIDLTRALNYIHLPVSAGDIASAKRRLLFDQLYNLQCRLALAKKKLAASASAVVAADVALLKQFVSTLSFELTSHQRQAIWQMAQELAGTKPMHRLLNGDVGSGKTVVAAALALLTVKTGWRVVVMAPTEILVQQHVNTLKGLLESFKVSVGQVTAHKKELTADILVGTHALLSDSVELSEIGLIVIDEQHRFGVKQRTKLRRKATAKNRAPHVLTLTATPIPRSLALVLFGDLDVTLNQLPAGRQPITTSVVQSKDEERVMLAMESAVKRGEQAYVVCPLIEEQRGEDLFIDEKMSVKKVYDQFKVGRFSKYRVGLLHGQLDSAEKERVLVNFRDGKIDILVSTSVVEVGVDIPKATVMLIESADRFGIAQLHQLRGRIGRRDLPATCYLMVREPSEQALSRCQQVAGSQDGFALAQFDLNQRGPGELVGIAQKGINQSFLKDLDVSLLEVAQRLARQRYS